uniref:Uncharacterized protein n=1 Tax=Rhizophora mucronata TaxID=61149 RepID=A0A2P2N701_RHIMU
MCIFLGYVGKFAHLHLDYSSLGYRYRNGSLVPFLILE